MKLVICCVLITLLFSLCSKDKDTGANVTINITSPVEDAVFQNGDSLIMEGKATSSEELHGYELVLRNATTGKIYFFEHIHDHASSFSVRKGWKDTLTAPALLEVLLSALTDDNGTKQTKQVNVYSQ